MIHLLTKNRGGVGINNGINKMSRTITDYVVTNVKIYEHAVVRSKRLQRVFQLDATCSR